MNMVGVGASLAAITGVVFSLLFRTHQTIPLITALPTLIFGMLWVRLLRWEKTLPGSEIRWGWLLSIVLAAANGGVAAGLLLSFERSFGTITDRIGRFFIGLFAGVTFGAIAWIPGLLATLFLFGVPIAWAQRQAKKGLTGQERGEGIVGASSMAIAMVALALTFSGAIRDAVSLETLFVRFLATISVVLGGAAMLTARQRDQERQRFVAAVERGEVEHFRVDTTDEGKVLVRVVSQGQGYRVRDFEEEIAALDSDGAAVNKPVRVATE